MSSWLRAAFTRHIRFYCALALGLIAFAVGRMADLPVALLAGGDVFYLVFLGLCLTMVAGQTAEDLKARARSEDEGMVIVFLIILATMLFFSVAVFEALNKKHLELLPLALAAAGAPLGWLVLHTAMAFHYADLHYFDDPSTAQDDERDLEFPGGGDACAWDFLYFSFVVGMTAQVSDVQVKTTVMRKAVLWHGIVSFFFNTVFIAMAVNAVVSLAS
ncbi:MAG TPA: DUF1345 domain-containing protein [Rhizomicrobium sp.]|jgi:uncharacterized membrane protein|nr:DUF1345 domain-containing protein [Rhizomicrobium sp.]